MMSPSSVIVYPSMIKLDEALAVYVDPSNIKIGAVVTPLWLSGYVCACADYGNIATRC